MGDFFVIQLSQHGYDSDYSSTIEKRFLYTFALIISVFVRNLCGFCADSENLQKQKVRKSIKKSPKPLGFRDFLWWTIQDLNL